MATLWEESIAGVGGPATQAASYALINSLGNIGGFTGSYVVGYFDDGGQRGTLILAAVLGIASAMVAFYPIPESAEMLDKAHEAGALVADSE